MSPTDDWNHMEPVESNSSCDNIARYLPPPQVPLCLMSQPFRKDCNWRRSIGGWGQEQSDGDFQKVHAGSEEEMVLPPNTQLYVITTTQPRRMVYSILLWGLLFHVLWGEEGGKRGVGGGMNSDRDFMWNRYLVPHLNALFFPFMTSSSWDLGQLYVLLLSDIWWINLHTQ